MNMKSDLKILVADDDPEQLRVIERLLKSEQYVVATVVNGQECLQALGTDKPDLLLLDVMLPDMSGVEICKKIKEDPGLTSIHVLLLSGVKTASDNISEGLETGADGYLIKPLKNRELLARIAVAHRIILAENALVDSEARFRNLFEHSTVGKSMTSLDGKILVNQAFCELTGYTKEELQYIRWQELTHPDDLPYDMEMVRLIISGECQSKRWEKRYIHKNGNIVWADVSTVLERDKEGNPLYFITSIIDISDRKLADHTIKSSESKYRTVYETTLEGLFQSTTDGRYLSVNPSFAEILGYDSPDDVISSVTNIGDQVYAEPRQRDEIKQLLATRKVVKGFEALLVRKDKSRIWVLINATAIVDDRGELQYYQGGMIDITGRKRTEIRLHKINRTYALITGINQAILRVHKPRELFWKACRIAIELGGFRMVWIGLFDPATKNMVPVAHAGVADDYLERLHISMNESDRGHGPTAAAFRGGKHVIVNDIASDPRMIPWRDDALQLGYHSSAAFPLNVAGVLAGTLNLYAAESHFFDEDELKLLDEMAENISFAMEFADKEELRIQAEAALKVSEERYRSLLTNLDAGIVVHSADTSIIMSNARASVLLGLSEDQLRGKLAIDPQWKFIKENNIPFRLEEYPVNLIILNKKSFSNLILGVIRSEDTDIVWLSVNGLPVMDNHGQIKEILISFIEITERVRTEAELRRSEAQFRAMVETIPLAIHLTVGIEQLTQYVNPMMVKLFGYTMNDIPSVEQWWPLAYPDEAYRKQISEEWNKKVGHAIETQSPIDPMETVVTCKDGSKKHISWGYITLGDKNYSFGLDLTDRVKAEEALKMLNTELENRVYDRTAQLLQANKELEAFSYSVSHDLRAPLRGIDGFTSILMDDYRNTLDDEGKRVCSLIRENTQRMGQLIDDLLGFSRLSRTEIQKSVIDMKTLIQTIYYDVTDGESRARIDLEIVDIRDACGDPTMMRQVLTNLLSNAVKFSSKKERAEIAVSCKQESQRLVYCIRDNGAGFDMTYAGKLFGVFQRLHSIKEFSGTGVGLAIVQRIIQRHGGEVWATGEVDQGARFYFSLPATVEELGAGR